MIVSRRSMAAVALALTLGGLNVFRPGAVLAQDYPTRPVKIIVPFGAGGPADVFSRVLAQHLSDALKEPFIVEDRLAPAPSSEPTPSPSRRLTATPCSQCRTPTRPMNRS